MSSEPFRFTKKPFHAVQPGRYWGQLIKVEPSRIKDKRTDEPLAEWTFRVLSEGPEKEALASGLTDTDWSPKRKTFAWAQALNGGIPFGTGEEEFFDPSPLYGKDCWIIVESKEGSDRSYVASLEPIIRQETPLPPPPLPRQPAEAGPVATAGEPAVDQTIPF